jgi:tRNA nucleotidyltransferase (CCA-adding enzyme)
MNKTPTAADIYSLAASLTDPTFLLPPDLEIAAQTVAKSSHHLVAVEHVAEESRRAMSGAEPRRFFDFLARLCVLDVWYPELNRLIGVPAGPPGHHDELDAYEHTMMVLSLIPAVADTDLDLEMLRWAALCHDLGKAYTDRTKWPAHHGHEQAGVVSVARLCNRLKLPEKYREAAELVCKEHIRVHRFLEMRPGKMVDLIVGADRTALGANGLAVVAMADSLGRIAAKKSIDGPNAILTCAEAIREETGWPIPPNLEGEAVGLYIRNEKGKAAVTVLEREGYL